MSESRKVVRVFLASPGDLVEERAAAKQAVEELNRNWFAFLGYHVELVGWEITVGGFGRPQAIINQDLDTCEYFLGLLYRRWGMPPDTSGKFTSGFEEEFSSSVTRLKATGKPEVHLFFKAIAPADLLDQGEQLKRVLAFKNEIVEGKTLLYAEFSDIPTFQEKIRRCLSTYIQQLIKEEELATNLVSQSSTENLISVDADLVSDAITENPPTTEAATQTATSEGPLTTEGAEFLRGVIARSEQFSADSSTTAIEVARYRLLGYVLRSDQNDKAILGVHDANLLFEARSEFSFSSRERGGLIIAGLVAYEQEVIPLWHWVAITGDIKLLSVMSAWGGTDESRTGALEAMRDIALPLRVDDDLPRNEFLESWFKIDAPTKIKVAALDYLSVCGTDEDLASVRAERDRNDYQTSNKATEVIVRITLRNSSHKAFLALQELQPETVSADLLRDIFDNCGGIPDEVLREGLSHRSSAVRLEIIRLLIARHAMNKETAEQLLTDANVQVHLEAMTFLVSQNRSFSKEEARKLLVEKSQGLYAILGSDQINEDRLEQFKDILRGSSVVVRYQHHAKPQMV